jgi:hypothetical protein
MHRILPLQILHPQLSIGVLPSFLKFLADRVLFARFALRMQTFR